MNIRSYLILATSILVIGCGDTTPPVAIPVTPLKTESVRPSLEKVQLGIDESVKSNELLESKLKEHTQVVNNQNLEIQESLTQAVRIKDKVLAQQAITELEVSNLVIGIQKVQQRNMFLETSNTDLLKIQQGQLITLKEAQSSAQDTEWKLVAKETEAVELRTHAEFLKTNLMNKNDEVVSLQKSLGNEKVHSAKSDVYRNWIMGLVGGFVLWSIIKNVLMLYFPTTKFRI